MVCKIVRKVQQFREFQLNAHQLDYIVQYIKIVAEHCPPCIRYAQHQGNNISCFAALQQEKGQVELQVHSAKVDDVEVGQLTARMQQLEAANSELQDQLAKEVRSHLQPIVIADPRQTVPFKL